MPTLIPNSARIDWRNQRILHNFHRTALAAHNTHCSALFDDGIGHLTLPDAPGLGVTLDWKALERNKIR